MSVADILNPNVPLIGGSGATKKQHCTVELLGKVIYGDMRYGYHLPCIDRGAQGAAVRINDRLSDKARNSERWRRLILRLGGCHKVESRRFWMRMALWAARSVEHLNTDPRVKACNDTLERWLAGEATDEEVWAARSEALDARYEAEAAAEAAAAAAEAAAEAVAAAAAAVAKDEALMDWYDEYLTAWSKIAADEGVLIPSDEDEAYAAFLREMDEVICSLPG